MCENTAERGADGTRLAALWRAVSTVRFFLCDNADVIHARRAARQHTRGFSYQVFITRRSYLRFVARLFIMSLCDNGGAARRKEGCFRCGRLTMPSRAANLYNSPKSINSGRLEGRVLSDSSNESNSRRVASIADSGAKCYAKRRNLRDFRKKRRFVSIFHPKDLHFVHRTTALLRTGTATSVLVSDDFILPTVVNNY